MSQKFTNLLKNCLQSHFGSDILYSDDHEYLSNTYLIYECFLIHKKNSNATNVYMYNNLLV